MSASVAAPESRSHYWVVPLVRALVAIAGGAIITFSAVHTARFGLLVFGGYALLAALALGILGWRRVSDPTSRRLFTIAGVVGLAAGVAALLLSGAGLGFFLYLVTVWAVVTGFLELSAGFRRRSSPPARDWMVVGGLTVLLGVVFLIVPPGLHDDYSAGGVHGVVTTPVVLVGVLGAYLAVIGVYLAIGAFSIKWNTDSAETREGTR